MRWRKSPDTRDTRERSAFLLLPRTINGETRWLELATWKESNVQVYQYILSGQTIVSRKWRPVRWIDTPPWRNPIPGATTPDIPKPPPPPPNRTKQETAP